MLLRYLDTCHPKLVDELSEDSWVALYQTPVSIAGHPAADWLNLAWQLCQDLRSDL